MILTVDIGNSNIVSVLYDMEGKRLKDDRRTTLKEASYDRYEEIMKDLRSVMGIPGNEPETVILSCVVPFIKEVVTNVLEEVFPEAQVMNLSMNLTPDLRIKLKQPRELGADIIATAVAAYNKYDDTTIIADLGSATKLSVVNEKREFLGGIIMPGIEFQARSLNQMIPHLPLIEINKPETVLGNGTTECIQSGIIYGTLCAILELSDKIEKELGTKCRKVITGGLSKLFTEKDLEEFVYDEFLLSDGLYYIAKNATYGEI